MFSLFTLLNFAAIISVIVFLIKMIKLKKNKEDSNKAKRNMLGAVAACIITFILMIITVPESEKNTETASKVSSEAQQETILDEGKMELPATSTTQEAVEETPVAQAPVEEATIEVTTPEAADESDLKKNFDKSFSDSASIFDNEVRNDKTGKWRLYKTSTSEDIVNHAVDYYKAYFASDSELHFIINFHPQQNSTTVIRVIDENTLNVTEHEYVAKEEHDANELGGGNVIADYFVDIETGAIEKIAD